MFDPGRQQSVFHVGKMKNAFRNDDYIWQTVPQ